jgi:peptidoglycan/xylan/chitin deacetylase (PgdA/CDA1 family)
MSTTDSMYFHFGFRMCLLLLVTGMNLMGYGQNLNSDFKITSFYQGKPGAISVTFDDVCYSQYSDALPELQKLNIRATFGVVGEWVSDEPAFIAEKESFEIKRMGWTQLKDLYNHGHELAAHGFLHERYNPLTPVPELARKMRMIKNLIEERTGAKVCTMNYPYSCASGNIPPAARVAGFLYGRTGLDTINAAEPRNMYLLASRAVLSDTLPDSTTFKKWIDQASSKWLILMYHHLFRKDSREMTLFRSRHVSYTYTVYPETFIRQIREVAASGYWIAPVKDIGKYIMERQRTELKIKIGKRGVKIITKMNLNEDIYDQTLTLAARVPWEHVRVSGGIVDGTFSSKEGILFIDFKPGARIIITKIP